MIIIDKITVPPRGGIIENHAYELFNIIGLLIKEFQRFSFEVSKP